MKSDTLNTINVRRLQFTATVGKWATHIHMTRAEMDTLVREMNDAMEFRQINDLMSSLRPDLIPLVRKMPPLNPGDSIYGMTIVETDAPGIYLTHERGEQIHENI